MPVFLVHLGAIDVRCTSDHRSECQNNNIIKYKYILRSISQISLSSVRESIKNSTVCRGGNTCIALYLQRFSLLQRAGNGEEGKQREKGGRRQTTIGINNTLFLVLLGVLSFLPVKTPGRTMVPLHVCGSLTNVPLCRTKAHGSLL